MKTAAIELLKNSGTKLDIKVPILFEFKNFLSLFFHFSNMVSKTPLKLEEN